jgi:hypothetical protein
MASRMDSYQASCFTDCSSALQPSLGADGCQSYAAPKADYLSNSILGRAIISQMIAITAAKAGNPKANQARNRRW